MNMGAQIGGFVTASLTPIIGDRFGWTAAFLVAAAFCAIGAVAWIMVDPEASLVESGGILRAPVATPHTVVAGSSKG
jgi:ACS family glucarate transporter-like MFS transporter